MYKFSLTERHSLLTLRKMTEALQQTSTGFFTKSMFTSNIWANGYFDESDRVAEIPYLYNLLYGLSVKAVEPYSSLRLSKLDKYFLTEFNQ